MAIEKQAVLIYASVFLGSSKKQHKGLHLVARLIIIAFI